MEIKLLTKNDLKSWKKLRLLALQDSPESFVSSYEEECYYTKKDRENGLEKSDIFGAFINGILVGSAGFYSLTTLKTKHRGVLFGMYIMPEYRSQGVASALVQAVIAHAKPRVLQIHLMCTVDNLSALRLYEKHGFKTYGTEPNALNVVGQFFDEHLMVLDLRTTTNK